MQAPLQAGFQAGDPAMFSTLVTASLATSVLAYTFPDCTSPPLSTNAVCDTTKSTAERVAGVVSLFTVQDIINNMGNSAPGVPAQGIPPYQWWSEGLHGIANVGPGVVFTDSGDYSSATSFPQAITMAAAFDDDLIHDVASVISTEARAFNNAGRAGLDYWTPNINPFKDPRWGRGQETPGEDAFRVKGYVNSLVPGLQGGIDPKLYKVLSTAKHYSGYDLEDWNNIPRYQFNAIISLQDLSEYYTQPFKAAIRDARVGSIMCSYNAVNGVPSCADSYLLGEVVRGTWKLEGWVVSDCDAISNVFNDHHYTDTFPEAVAATLKAGTDIDCGGTYGEELPAAFNQSLITEGDLRQALTRQYTTLVRLGYFDPAENQPYRQLSWKDVNSPAAEVLAYRAAAEAIVLLKNDGTLPLKSTVKTLAMIGPWANATTQMQGNYFGIAFNLVSPLQAAINAGYTVKFATGTGIDTTDTSGFADAIAAAKAADAIIYLGGIDDSVEGESLDRLEITWPGNQLDLIGQLKALKKPLIVAQFGTSVDSSSLKSDPAIGGMLWAGYPGMLGGTAVMDIIKGKTAPAGRMPITTYPADYVNLPMTDMNLRPSSSSPGRTYQWYTGTPVFEFGFGLHYTSFAVSFAQRPPATFNIQALIRAGSSAQFLDLATFASFSVNVHNTGKVTSDYAALLFVSGNHGPAPQPNKQLVSYSKVKAVAPGRTSTATLKVTLGAIARADANGNLWVYPGSYKVTVDTPGLVSANFVLQGNAAQVSAWPQPPASS
ncbi:glycoside hydrolase family 3 protein [Mycena floridula]|nr:glycoside hydrolase family 3 protein [Mycena floridula]